MTTEVSPISVRPVRWTMPMCAMSKRRRASAAEPPHLGERHRGVSFVDEVKRASTARPLARVAVERDGRAAAAGHDAARDRPDVDGVRGQLEKVLCLFFGGPFAAAAADRREEGQLVALVQHDFEVARVLLVDGDEERGAEATQVRVVGEQPLEGGARLRAGRERKRQLVGRGIARRAEEEDAHAHVVLHVRGPRVRALLLFVARLHPSRSTFLPA